MLQQGTDDSVASVVTLLAWGDDHRLKPLVRPRLTEWLALPLSGPCTVFLGRHPSNVETLASGVVLQMEEPLRFLVLHMPFPVVFVVVTRPDVHYRSVVGRRAALHVQTFARDDAHLFE